MSGSLYFSIAEAFDALQDQVVPWHDREWGDRTRKPLVTVALKMCEEAGEVAGAAVKMGEGRRTVEDLAGEVGDVVIALATVCDRAGITLGDAVMHRWYTDVSKRVNPNRAA